MRARCEATGRNKRPAANGDAKSQQLQRRCQKPTAATGRSPPSMEAPPQSVYCVPEAARGLRWGCGWQAASQRRQVPGRTTAIGHASSRPATPHCCHRRLTPPDGAAATQPLSPFTGPWVGMQQQRASPGEGGRRCCTRGCRLQACGVSQPVTQTAGRPVHTLRH